MNLIKNSFRYSFFIFLIAGCSKSKNPSIVPPAPVPAGNKITSYLESSENFTNPERGFYGQTVSYSTQPSPLTTVYLDGLKNKNVSLIRRLYCFNTFRSAPISAGFLEHIQNDMDLVRNSGFKMILRFAYTFNDPAPWDDAPESIVMSHIDQLTPYIQNNADVIAILEAGFIGRWGEWHTSSNGLANTATMKTVLFKLLDVLPKSRNVVVRYQQAKKDIFGINEPIGDAEAFNQTNRSRTGHLNECFLAAEDDWGTYWPMDAASLEAQKNFLNQESKYLPQVGETCNCNPPRSDCSTAVKELEKMRWSAINRDYIECVLNSWVAQGCYEEIAKRLGYRFRLLSSEIPRSVKVDSNFMFKLVLKNTGFASPYNAHNMELVFRSKTSGAVTKIKLNQDVRKWLPDSNEIKLDISVLIPSNFALGEYDLLINFPDPALTLNSNIAYSIRLANENVWEAATGYNSLLTSVTIFK